MSLNYPNSDIDKYLLLSADASPDLLTILSLIISHFSF
jgi:hypothetical protein